MYNDYIKKEGNMKQLTQSQEELINNLENKGMLDEAMLDMAIFKSKFQSLFSAKAVWQRFIRSN